MTLKKGDMVLVSSPHSEYAGFTGIIKRIKKSTNIIVKLTSIRKSVWFVSRDLVKITESQKEELEKLGENMSGVLSS